MIINPFVDSKSLHFLTEAALLHCYKSSQSPVNIESAKVVCHFELPYPERKETFATLGIEEKNNSLPEFTESKEIFTKLKKNYKKYSIISEKNCYAIWTNLIVTAVLADNKKIARMLAICVAICQVFTQRSIRPISINDCFSKECKPQFITFAKKFLADNNCDPNETILPFLQSLSYTTK